MKRHVIAAIVAAALGASAAAEAAVYRVGIGPGCGHATLQSAVDAALDQYDPSDPPVLYVSRSIARANTYIAGGLTIVGGFETCTSPIPKTRTRIEGSLIAATGRGGPLLKLENLDFVGHRSDGQVGGGALYIRAGLNWRRDVHLRNVSIRGASARRGGGIAIDGSRQYTQPLVVTLEQTQIQGNEAFDELGPGGTRIVGQGGGIHCTGGRQVRIVFGPGTTVSGNRATEGGGLYANGCSVETVEPQLGAPALRLLDNQAVDGAGVYARRASIDFTGALVSGNRASHSGGALYLTAATTELDGGDATFQGNHAEVRGGVLVVNEGAVARLWSRRACSGAWCARLSSNTSGGDTAVASVSGYGSRLQLERVDVRHNVNAAGMPGISAGAYATLDIGGLVATGNRMGALFEVTGGAFGRVAFVTTHGNELLEVFRASHPAALFVGGSIVDERAPAVVLARNGAPATGIECVIVHELESIPDAQLAMVADPRFADAARGNLRLTVESPAVDYCSAASWMPPGEDLDGAVRGVDQPAVPNRYGPYDLGAYEFRTGE